MIEVLTRLDHLQPENAVANRLLAAAQWQAGDSDGVIATLTPFANGADADDYMLTLLARAYEARDDRVTAAAYLDRVAQPSVRAANFAAPSADVDGLDWSVNDGAAEKAQHARALLAAGEGGQALDLALALQRANPGAPDAHMLAGDIWSALGQWPRAIDAYRRAANLRFSEGNALRLIAAFGQAGRANDAARVLNLFLAQNPINVSARVLQADRLMADGRFADAATVLEALRDRIGPRDIAIGANLAWCYFKTDRIDDAVATAAQAYRLAPANPRVSHSYGWILYKSGRNPRGALALLQQAAAQAPDWDLARTHLAEAEMVHGRAPIG
jgi:tetratricopeptide (TPR) repeat protein